MKHLLLLLLILFSPVAAHMPAGYKLKLSTEVGGYSVRIVVFPAEPRVNRTSEIIVGVVKMETSEPFEGEVWINGSPARRFSLAFYEQNLTFARAGRYEVPIELRTEKENFTTTVSVTAVEERDSPLVLPLLLFTAVGAVIVAVWYLRRRRT